ncbi:helix-turn-helix transcriptional regulator [Streptomyces sp. NBC_01214]|uniref:helix-turn-helix domain-containing protein n=1 Tax=Streptomyces sp. NBC_01214 TaxID=2903777 RepID=UPI0022542A46|nr:helix-turn-helix transcriptional regulator [Streptomyces sp. NBC_01214]MCX4801746.1 helix-turn-helix transcriptional regulator [Streptomyces sp. NBC_01214]
MTAPARPELTALEATVLRMVADGWTYAEIATRLTYTTSGITSVASRMFPKLGANSAPHAVFLACRAGILDGRPFLRHGDHAGYETHIRRRIPLCDACREGEKAYRDGLKAARHAQEAA